MIGLGILPSDFVRRDLFRQLVEDLTGFSRFPARLLEANLHILASNQDVIGGDIVQLLSSYQAARRLQCDTSDVSKVLLEDERYRPLLVQVTLLFYVGAIRLNGRWKRCGRLQHESALVWRTLETHPPMTRGRSGFGDWGHLPEDISSL
ncbi:hypothetical protein [Rhizobium leguminosarum]|uniref:hypothetical protein n=1 Tax=Rhizobium leguminosarum TaxID=384 RepID=UPI003F9BF850